MLKSGQLKVERLINHADYNPITQFSFLLDPKTSELNLLLSFFREHGISLLAWSFLENSDNAIVRCVVNYPDVARTTLTKTTMPHHVNNVLAIELNSVADVPTVFSEMFSAEVKPHYAYPLMVHPNGKSGLIIQTENNAFASKVLNNIGIKLLSQNDLGR